MSPLVARSQTYTGTGNASEVFVGSETETYLRYVELTDTTSSENWSIRPLSPAQIARLDQRAGGNPWAARLRGFASPRPPFEAGLLSPSVSVRFNSQFPYGSNDGPIWAGRGATWAAQVGVFARIGPLSLTLMPTAFRAENVAFPVAPSPLPCGCGNPDYSSAVDMPQRFGTTAYQRLDPGQSTVRIDGFGISAGISTGNEGWGPMVDYPFILGNNAPGFPHIFVGSAQPIPILIGRLHARVLYGRLDQSDYSPVTGSKYYNSLLEAGRLRFGSGLILAFQPRGLDGLEIGASRFIHSIWPRTGIPRSYVRKPLQAFLKVNLQGIDQQIAATDNQIASFFARWAFKPSGLEVYGEYGRDDNAYDFRDLMQEPDHQRAYSVGVAKVIRHQNGSFSVLRGEMISFLLPPLATTGRGEGTVYVNFLSRQGHTNRGQLLGADVGVGAAAGSTLRWDQYSAGGRWSVFWRRDVRRETADPSISSAAMPQISDVLHAFGFERVKFTRHFDVTSSLTLMRDLSRDFANSRFNANAVMGITLPR
jgi:hypothetical protein